MANGNNILSLQDKLRVGKRKLGLGQNNNLSFLFEPDKTKAPQGELLDIILRGAEQPVLDKTLTPEELKQREEEIKKRKTPEYKQQQLAEQLESQVTQTTLQESGIDLPGKYGDDGEVSDIEEFFKGVYESPQYQVPIALGGITEMINQIAAKTDVTRADIGGRLARGLGVTPPDEYYKKTGRWFDPEISKLRDLSNDLIRFGVQRQLELNPPDDSFAYDLGAGVSTVLQAIGVSVPATLLMGPVGGFLSGFGYTATLEGGLAYKDALDYGLSEGDASKVGMVVGAINGILEILPIGRILKKTGIGNKVTGEITQKVIKDGLFKRVGKEAVKQGVWEAGTEMSQEVTSLIAETLYKESEDVPELKEWLDRVWKSGSLGGIIGGVLGGAGGVRTRQQTEKKEPISDIEREKIEVDTEGIERVEVFNALMRGEKVPTELVDKYPGIVEEVQKEQAKEEPKLFQKRKPDIEVGRKFDFFGDKFEVTDVTQQKVKGRLEGDGIRFEMDISDFIKKYGIKEKPIEKVEEVKKPVEPTVEKPEVKPVEEDIRSIAQKSATYEEFEERVFKEIYRPKRNIQEVEVGETIRFVPKTSGEAWFGSETMYQYDDGSIIGKIIKKNPKSVTIEEGGKQYKISPKALATKDLTELEAVATEVQGKELYEKYKGEPEGKPKVEKPVIKEPETPLMKKAFKEKGKLEDIEKVVEKKPPQMLKQEREKSLEELNEYRMTIKQERDRQLRIIYRNISTEEEVTEAKKRFKELDTELEFIEDKIEQFRPKEDKKEKEARTKAGYTIDTTGDVVVGDEVYFEKDVWGGTYKKPIYEGAETIKAKVIRESYGKEKGQHTFTLELADGSTMRIKGRNLYKHGVWRKKWADETAREEAAEEKHVRGERVREAKRMRREGEEPFLKQEEIEEADKRFTDMPADEKQAAIAELYKGVNKGWKVEFKNLDDLNAAGVTELVNKVVKIDPEVADFTTFLEESFHSSMVALNKPKMARIMLRRNGWDGKGDITDVFRPRVENPRPYEEHPEDWTGNKSLTNAHENLAKKYVDWRQGKIKDTSGVFAQLKSLWEKIANYFKGAGFMNEAKYFRDLASGKLKAKGKEVREVEGEPVLAQAFDPHKVSIQKFGPAETPYAVFIPRGDLPTKYAKTKAEAEKLGEQMQRKWNAKREKEIQFDRYKKTGTYYGEYQGEKIRVSDHPYGVKTRDIEGGRIEGYRADLKEYIKDEINGIEFYRNKDYTDFVFPQKYALRNFRNIEVEIKKQIDALRGEEPLLKQERVEKEIEKIEKKIPEKPVKKQPRTLINERIKDIKRGSELGKRDLRENLEKLKRQINIYARRYLPKDLRKSEITPLLTEVKNAKNIRDVESAMDRIDRIANRTHDRNAINKIETTLKKIKPKIVSGKPVGALTAETQKVIDKIKGSKKKYIKGIKDYTREETLTRQDELLTQLEEVKGWMTDEITEELFLLNTFGNLKGKTGASLDIAVKELNNLIEKGRFERLRREGNRKAEQELKVDKYIDSVTGGEGIYKQATARKKGLEEETITKRTMLRYFDAHNQTLPSLLDKMAREKHGYLQSEMAEWVGKTLLDANKNKWANTNEITENIKTEFKKIYNIKGRALRKGVRGLSSVDMKLAKRLGESAKRVKNTGIFITEANKKVELDISKEEGAKLLAWSKDEEIKNDLIRMGFNDESFQQLNKFVDPATKRAIEYGMDFLNSYYERINKKFEEMYFTSLPKVRNYFPVKRDKGGEIAEDFVLEKNKIHVGMTYSAIKARIRNQNDLLIRGGFTDTLLSHIIQSEHFQAFVKPMQELRGVLQNDKFQKVVEQQYGYEYVKIINKYLDDIARGGIDQILKVAPIDKRRGAFAKSVIALNILPFIKQHASHPAYAVSIPIRKYVAGSIDFFRHPIKNARILKASVWLRMRAEKGWTRDVQVALKRGGLDPNNLTNQMMFMTKIGDRNAIISGGWSVFKHHLGKDANTIINKLRAGEELTETEQKKYNFAMTEFEFRSATTQQSGLDFLLDTFQRGGSWAKLFTMFQNSQKSYYRIESYAWRNLFKGKNVKEATKSLMISRFILPQAFQFMANGFEWDWEDQLRAYLLGSMNGVFLVGGAAEYAISRGQGGYDYGYDANPLEYIAEETGETVDKVRKAFEDKIKTTEVNEGEITVDEVLEVTDGIIDVLSKIVGVPYAPVKKTTKGILDYLSGETDDPRRALGYSEWMLGKEERAEKRTIKRMLQQSRAEVFNVEEEKEFYSDLAEAWKDEIITKEEYEDYKEQFEKNQDPEVREKRRVTKEKREAKKRGETIPKETIKELKPKGLKEGVKEIKPKGL